MSSKRIQEFTAALDEEIATLKKGKGGSTIKVFNGRFLRNVSGHFVYVFQTESLQASLDDVPGEMQVAGRTYGAQILVTHGTEIEIGIDSNLGEHITEAMLITKLWYLLELLKKKLNERQSESTAIDFQLSELIFEGQSKQLTNDDPKYLQSSELLNDAQQIAIKSSFNNQLLLIWGPPGTGKTKTIATVVESHLNAGRTVLLVSHANNAVDEALEDVAEHLKATSFYEEGKLVRLGKPQEGHLKTLEKEYELVLPEKIVERKSAVLAKERAELTVKKDECESMLAKYEAVTQVIDKAKEQAGNILKLKSVLVENERQKQGALQEKELLSRKLKEEEVRLTEAQTAGAIKRLFRGLNPEKIRASMSALKFKLGASENVAKELTNRPRQQNLYPIFGSGNFPSV